MKWRLALDLGTNSIGWAAFRLKDGKDHPGWQDLDWLDGGSRIFSDSREPAAKGRVGDPLGVAKRLAKGARRNRDRGKNRMGHLEGLLIDYGLLPADKKARAALKKLEPLEMRAEAVARELQPFELGRALLHLGKRRGFKSNRKEVTDEKEEGRIKEGMAALDKALAHMTLGQFLWAKRQAQLAHDKAGKRGEKESLRFRDDVGFFPARRHTETEFAAIRAKQAPFHDLEDEAWDLIASAGILFQHQMKAPERGWCSLRPEEQRHWKDTPIAHSFRIYNEVTNLRWVTPDQQRLRLTADQQQAIIDELLITKTQKTWSALAKLKDRNKKRLFPKEGYFSHDDGRRKGLNGHRIYAILADDPVLGSLLKAPSPGWLDDIVAVLHEESDPDRLADRLAAEFDLSPAEIDALGNLPLAPGTVQLSRKVMEELVPLMRDQGLQYDDAVAALTDKDGNALHHSLGEQEELLSELPYYGAILRDAVTGGDGKKDPIKDIEGHYGRIANPTVHVALNQLRKLVNCLIDRFGSNPVSIHVEVSRELKNGPRAVMQINKDIAANTKANDRRAQMWREWTKGAEPRRRDILKIKLWEELGKDDISRRCPFTGRNISGQHLINGDVEIEHILPFSRSYDNSNANLTLAFTSANRKKGNKTPWEAFSGDDHAWAIIQDNLPHLPKAKRWRFAQDAMERFNNRELQGEDAFLARQLTDNAYIARIARRYMTRVTPDVVTIPGRMTALLRAKWGLNSLLGDHNYKERNDHRHHVIDAFVVGLSSRGLLQAVSAASKRGADDLYNLEVPDLPDNLRHAFADRLATIIASHKQDHGRGGAFFKETAYGAVKDQALDPELGDTYRLVTRKPLANLSHKELNAIRDPLWRRRIQEYLQERGYFELTKAKEQDDSRQKLLQAFGKANRVRRIRILVSQTTAVQIQSVTNKWYAVDSYACCDIWLLPPDKKGKRKAEPVYWNYIEISDPTGGEPHHRKPHAGAKFLMRLFKHDLVAFTENEELVLRRVKGFSVSNDRLDLTLVNASDAPRQFFGVNVLISHGLQKLTITPDGRIRGLPHGVSRKPLS